MRTLRLTILFLFAAISTSCSQPATIWLLNNTGKYLSVEANEKQIFIEPKSAKKFFAVSSEVTVTGEGINWKYELDNLPLEHLHWVRSYFFPKRMFYVQINASGNIWVLAGKIKQPVSEHIEQPEGFPLAPNT
ncbi:MAG: hypothetical protein MI976_14980 [Pseudomonadales bacterium]|nr:hypothetical protein [Pseudomonadales bacterium]